jgi:hypothetical protein
MQQPEAIQDIPKDITLDKVKGGFENWKESISISMSPTTASYDHQPLPPMTDGTRESGKTGHINYQSKGDLSSVLLHPGTHCEARQVTNTMVNHGQFYD